jgi:hypothetical protein
METRPFARAIAAILVSGVFSSPLSAGASDPEFGVAKSQAGAVVVWNEPPAYFTLELPGSRFVHQKQLPGASFSVDDRVVQVFTARIALFSDPSCESDPHRCYQDWELGYRRSMLGRSIAARDLASSVPDFRFWEVDVPEEISGSTNGSVTKQVYATRVIEHVVLVLSCSVIRAEPPASAEWYLASIARSLHVSDEPIDFEAVRQELAKKQRSTPPPEGSDSAAQQGAAASRQGPDSDPPR